MTDAEYDYLFRDADPRWKAYYRMRREEYRKQHPRTNFDVWRDALTPEDFVRISGQWCGNFPFCDECGKNGECLMGFYDWANAPADNFPRLRKPEKCPQCGHPSRFQMTCYGQDVFFCPEHGAFWTRIGESNAPAKEEK